eukprot:g9453.t1
MSLRWARPRYSEIEGRPEFQTGVKIKSSSAGRGRGGGDDEDKDTTTGERSKRLERKPPVPTAAAAAGSHAVAGARTAHKPRDGSVMRDRLSPDRSVRRTKSLGNRGIATERRSKGKERVMPSHDHKAESIDAGRSSSRGSDRKRLLHMLRQAVEEMDVLRRDVVSASRERAVWKKRDGTLSLTVSRLEDRCKVLERNVQASTDATEGAEARAKDAEARFARLVVWAREEEGRRLQAEERLAKACEAGQALEARNKALEHEACESKRQLEERRFKLEGALEDLRTRTTENERLEAQATTVRGQAEALRELADARGLEVQDLRQKITGLVKEAKGMSSENVDLRKHMSSEQERWRALERSRAKQDERRRTEMQQKCDDIHALRYRVQELEARVSSETARRQGAEEDARRSQEMERRSMEELLEGRKAAMPVRTEVALGHSFSSHLSDPEPGGGRPAPVTRVAWKSWGNHRDLASGSARDTATTATGAMTSRARSPATISDLMNISSAGRVHRDNRDRGNQGQPTDTWRWREATTTRGADYRAAVTDRSAYAPSPIPSPSPSPAFAPLSAARPPPPPLSAASLRASLRRPGGERSRSRSPSPKASSVTPLTQAGPDPSLRPRPLAFSPVGPRLDNDHDNGRFRREGMSRATTSRPPPRRAPSEDQDGGDEGCGRRGSLSGSDGGPEWWAGGGSSGEDEEGLDGNPGLPAQESSDQQDKPLHTVCL